MVHNAGIHTSDALISTDTIKTTQKETPTPVSKTTITDTFNINVIAPTLISQKIVPYMAPGSSIIFIGSTLSEIGVSGRLSYTASKHAVVGLMRAITQDLFATKIHTTCICPGFTNTPMINSIIDPEFIKSKVSYGRLIDPSEIAKIVLMVTRTPSFNGSIVHCNLGQKVT